MSYPNWFVPNGWPGAGSVRGPTSGTALRGPYGAISGAATARTVKNMRMIRPAIAVLLWNTCSPMSCIRRPTTIARARKGEITPPTFTTSTVPMSTP